MKKHFIFRILIFLILYSTLGFYISWNSWVWLHTVFDLEDKWIYGVIAGLLFYSYLIGRALKHLLFLRIFVSYWFAVLQYALLLLPIADLAVWIMTLLGLSKEMLIAWTGAVILLLFCIIFLY